MAKVRSRYADQLESSAASPDGMVAFPESFSTRRGTLQKQIHKKLPEAMCLSILVAAEMENPFDPYDIEINKKNYDYALRQYARDLGVPGSWADQVRDSVDVISPERTRGPWKGWALAIGGGLVALASVPLAFALAPAGLAGGAVFLSGLAALGGPAGMVGGLSVVAGVAAAGGSTMAAGVFIAGSAAQVEARLKVLHANAHAKHSLRPATDVPEIRALEAMLVELREDLSAHREIDDKKSSKPIKDLKKKIKSVEAVLEALNDLLSKKGDSD